MTEEQRERLEEIRGFVSDADWGRFISKQGQIKLARELKELERLEHNDRPTTEK